MKWNYGVSALAREILPREKNALSSEKPSELISRSTQDEISAWFKFTPVLKPGSNFTQGLIMYDFKVPLKSIFNPALFYVQCSTL